jgi:uncharacterized protein (TIGR03663 family)
VSAADFSSTVKKILSFESIFLLVVLLTAFLRFYQLDFKLFHHDEAIHAWFAYELLTKGTYVYDPMYHGPLLYYLTTALFRVFGDTDLVGRLFPALLGTLIVPLVYAVYRLGYLDKRQTIVAGLLVAISPDMIYFSRFLRQDMFMLFFTMLMVVSLLFYFEKGQTRYALAAAVAAAGGLCLKEEMPLILIFIGLFFLYMIIRKRFVLPPSWKVDLVLGIVVIAGIMSVLYSAFGMHWDTLWTGPFKAIDHWLAMHNQQRLGGPWFFYILLLGLYEVPIFGLAIISIAGYVAVRGNSRVVSILKREPAAEQPALQIRDRREDFLLLSLWWMVCSMGMYAFIGEKVPWLIVQQLLPMCFVASYLFREARSGDRLALQGAGKTPTWGPGTIIGIVIVTAVSLLGMGVTLMKALAGHELVLTLIVPFVVLILVAGFLYQNRDRVVAPARKAQGVVTSLLPIVAILLFGVLLVGMTHHVAYSPNDISEPIVQVQNSEDLRGLFQELDASNKTVIASANYWPLPWYYRGDKWNTITFYGAKVADTQIYQGDFDLAIVNSADSYPYLAGYKKETIHLNYWFSYYDNQNRLLDYYMQRDGKLGSMDLDIFTKIRPLS